MTSPASGSDLAAYDRLHPEIRRWIREQGWNALRPIQVRTIEALSTGSTDILISASTASGKTEAAFLPILSRVAGRARPGLSVLYVSPLKALINDQFRRLDLLCERLELTVVRWHGDAPQAAKDRTRKNPKGIALITPESIEAMLGRRPADAHRLFGALDYIVIDELHAFMASPRGLHLAMLLKRIDGLAERPATRVGLSATIGDLGQAAAWLRPDDPDRVEVLKDADGTLDLRLQIRGYVSGARGRLPQAIGEVEDEAGDDDDAAGQDEPLDPVAAHLFRTLRGSNNLVFGGSRQVVEMIADALRRQCEREGVANEFFPHHGNLSRDLREELELRLKDGDLPTTAVCTTTLELGIAIGSVKSIAQIGPPRSISSLRQRLGRTGRREGVPAILRVYVRQPALDHRSDILDGLRPGVVQAVAAIRLLAARFVEPATPSAAIPTAVLHQTLSIIAERGGARADAIHRLLCGPGPLASVTPRDYAEILRSAAGERLIEQAPDGTLMLGARGEVVVHARDFFALFQGTDEWRLLVGAKALGTIPLSNTVAKGGLVLFAGRRWLIDDVDEPTRTLLVSPHRSGVVPKFEPVGGEQMHDALVEEMRRVYEAEDVPDYLDGTAKILLAEGRAAYHRLRLDSTLVLAAGSDTHLFPWVGTAGASVLVVALASMGIAAEENGIGLTVPGIGTQLVKEALSRLASGASADFRDLEAHTGALRGEKFDDFFGEDLLRRFWRRRNEAAIVTLPAVARRLLNQSNQVAPSLGR